MFSLNFFVSLNLTSSIFHPSILFYYIICKRTLKSIRYIFKANYWQWVDNKFCKRSLFFPSFCFLMSSSDLFSVNTKKLFWSKNYLQDCVTKMTMWCRRQVYFHQRLLSSSAGPMYNSSTPLTLEFQKKVQIAYSCSNITTTLIQISRLFYFGFFSKTNPQMMI